MLSSLFKLFWGKFFQRVELHRRCREAKGRETFTAESFQHMLASQDENRIKRIGAWLGYGRSGMDIAHLYFALAETAEISSKVAVTEFVAALKAAYPQHSIVGPRQVQKSVNYLKNLSPNRKQTARMNPSIALPSTSSRPKYCSLPLKQLTEINSFQFVQFVFGSAN